MVYRPDRVVLARTLASCCAAPEFARGLLLDNSDDDGHEAGLRDLLRGFPRFSYRRNPAGNAGFGYGHNLAFRELPAASFHAVINPDLVFEPDAIIALLAELREHSQTVLVGPALFHPDGTRQHLCKRYPTVRALFARRFAPRWLLRHTTLSLDADFYEMRDADYEASIEPEFLSGALMLFRHDAYVALHGFDERFFMYLEDCDITLRARKLGRVSYVPAARVTHVWARGSHRSLRLTWATLVSTLKLFNKHGWRWRDPRIGNRS